MSEREQARCLLARDSVALPLLVAPDLVADHGREPEPPLEGEGKIALAEVLRLLGHVHRAKRLEEGEGDIRRDAAGEASNV